MTLNEFKAWFSGFTESMDGVPDEKQWERIKARVKEIDNVAITNTVFVDRYVEPYRRYWPNVPYWSFGAAGGGAQVYGGGDDVIERGIAGYKEPGFDRSFNSQSAMLDLGKAEYKACVVS